MTRRARRSNTDRRGAHIGRGDRAFLPLQRLREVRWEESVALSQARRAGLGEYMLRHMDCHCGSVSCLCVPILMRWDESERRWVPANLGSKAR